MLFAIATPGPLVKVDVDDVDAALAVAKRQMPLKRGWSHEVTYGKDGQRATLRARNSRGRVVNAFRVFPARDLVYVSTGLPVHPDA